MKPPSVLFLNRVYPPAEGATGQLLADLARGLRKAGWQVTVVTGRAMARSVATETVDGVRVERVGVLPFSRSSHWRRALGYLTVYPALLWRALRLPRADIVVTMTDPPLLLVLGPVLRWIQGCRLVHWAQDIYPEVAEELGVLRHGGWLARLCTRLSTWALRRHQRTIVVGRCMKDRLLRRGLPADTIRVLANWTHASPVEPSSNLFRREHHLEGSWVVMYSGNLGLAHPFDAILAAAARLNFTHPDILFLFVGSGPRLAEVQRQAQARSLANVRFLPPQPRETLAHSLSAADLHLASMRESLCGLVVPSKVYGILGAGRPCVFLGPKASEAARVLEEFQCGSVLDPGNGDALARCIVEWRSQPERLRDAGQRAEQAARRSCLDATVPAFHEILLEVAAEGAALTLQQTASSTHA